MSDTSRKSVDLTPKPLMTMSDHEDTILNMAYLPREERVVTCSNDGLVRIWNVEDGEQEGMSMKHDGYVLCLAVTRDGKRILSGGYDHQMKVWDVETHEPIEGWEDHTGGIRCIAMSPDDQLVASGGDDGKIVIREMKEGGQIKHAIQAGMWVLSVSFSPNGEKVAAAVYDVEDGHGIRVYDGESGELLLGPIKGHKDYVNCVLWSLDGCRLFSASDDRSIRCWNSETGEPIGQPWTGHTYWVISLSLSPDGTRLASASHDHTVRLWDAQSGEPIEQPLQHDHWLRAVTFSPTGEFVACGGDDKKVSIWRVPWWDDGQKQAHDSFLDLPAVPAPKGLAHNQAQLDVDFLDLPCRPITSSSQPLVHPDPTPIVTRVQRFWRRLVVPRSASSPSQPATELQPTKARRFWPAIPPLAETSSNNGHGIHESLDSLSKLPGTATHHTQQAAPMHQRVLNKVGDTFTNLFAPRPAIAAQNNDIGEMVQPVQPVQVAAGRDRTYWLIIEPIRYTPIKRFWFMLLYCRKPPADEEDDCQNAGAKPDSSLTPANGAVIQNQPGSIEMVVMNSPSNIPAVPENLTASAHSSPVEQLKPSTVLHAAFRPPSENAHIASPQPSSQNVDLSSTNLLSPDEMQMLQEYRRLTGKSPIVSVMVAEPLSGTAHNNVSFVYPIPSTPPPQSRNSVTPNTPSIQLPSSHQPHLHVNARPSQLLVTLDPLLNVAPGLLSPSLSSASSCLSPSPPQDTIIKSKPSDLPTSINNTPEPYLETDTQSKMVQPMNTVQANTNTADRMFRGELANWWWDA